MKVDGEGREHLLDGVKGEVHVVVLRVQDLFKLSLHPFLNQIYYLLNDKAWSYSSVVLVVDGPVFVDPNLHLRLFAEANRKDGGVVYAVLLA
jgi:hypothetical protein